MTIDNAANLHVIGQTTCPNCGRRGAQHFQFSIRQSYVSEGIYSHDLHDECAVRVRCEPEAGGCGEDFVAVAQMLPVVANIGEKKQA